MKEPAIKTNRYAPGWYVLDTFSSTLPEAIMSGPWPSREIAIADRDEMNIADDCIVRRFERRS